MDNMKKCKSLESLDKKKHDLNDSLNILKNFIKKIKANAKNLIAIMIIIFNIQTEDFFTL